MLIFSSFFVTIDKHTKKITILRDMVSQLKASIGFNGPRQSHKAFLKQLTGLEINMDWAV